MQSPRITATPSTARQVLHLLVSYGCPNNLNVFD